MHDSLNIVIQDAVDLLKLILLAKLVRLTGVVWDVQYEIYKLNIAFICKFGADASDVARIEYSVGDIEGLFENRMEEAANLLNQRYLKKRGRDLFGVNEAYDIRFWKLCL